MRVPYAKPYQTEPQLVEQLTGRGLIINDTHNAVSYLSSIGYYKLSAYMHPFLKNPKGNHQFHRNVTFDNILSLYKFDKKLKMLILNEIEKIEVAIKVAIVDEGCQYFDSPFWLTSNSSYIHNGFSATLNIISREYNHTNEEFVNHFKSKYNNNYPPAWIITELLTFGNITKIFSALKPGAKKRIAKRFNLSSEPFQSWIGILHLDRNSCCHHSRLWNKWLAIEPVIPTRNPPSWLEDIPRKRSTYFDLCIIKHFLDIISPNNDMATKLKKLLQDYPIVYPPSMGFPDSWAESDLWA